MSVLLCTFNGARYLPAQVQSYLAQSHKNWSLHVSDDGSVDGTLEVLKGFRTDIARRRLEIVAGPTEGFAKNFLSLLCNASVGEGFVAFSDQDDVWLPQKLARAVEALRDVPSSVPAVYGGRTQVVDGQLAPIRLSPLFQRRPSFRNALLQNVAGGNTMVLNAAAVALVRQAGAELDVVSHDWWIYQLVTGHGGRLIYDPEPMLLYRQHDGNITGENRSLPGLVTRLNSLRTGRYWSWIERNVAALQRFPELLAPESREIVDEMARLLACAPLQRYRKFGRLGLYRQHPIETHILRFALLTTASAKRSRT